MSTIFDHVDTQSHRRKTKMLECAIMSGFIDATRPLKADVIVHNSDTIRTGTVVAELKHDPENAVLNAGGYRQYNMIIDTVWLVCCLCTIIPVISYVYMVNTTNTLESWMYNIPYTCSLFYFGLVVSLPAASVHIFCCILVYSRSCKVGIFLCMISVVLLVTTVQDACVKYNAASFTIDYYILAIGCVAGLVGQMMFIDSCPVTPERKQWAVALLSICVVLEILSLVAVTISASTQTQIPSKGLIYVRSGPIALSFVVYTFSTYYSLYPVRVVCGTV